MTTLYVDSRGQAVQTLACHDLSTNLNDATPSLTLVTPQESIKVYRFFAYATTEIVFERETAPTTWTAEASFVLPAGSVQFVNVSANLRVMPTAIGTPATPQIAYTRMK
jgi:hypothetical protein